MSIEQKQQLVLQLTGATAAGELSWEQLPGDSYRTQWHNRRVYLERLRDDPICLVVMTADGNDAAVTVNEAMLRSAILELKRLVEQQLEPAEQQRRQDRAGALAARLALEQQREAAELTALLTNRSG